MNINFVSVFCVAPVLSVPSAAHLIAAEFYYAQTTVPQSASSPAPVPIGGLLLNLRAATKDFNTAVVTLNLPNLTLGEPVTKGALLGATFQIVAPFSPSGPVVAAAVIGGCATCTSIPGAQGMTIVAKVPLNTSSQLVEGEWGSNGNCTVSTQTFASISALLVKDQMVSDGGEVRGIR